jgi:hypothetical protein
MTKLPTWASNKLGRALLSEIVANPPEPRIIRDKDWGTRDTPHYRHPLAGKLRQMREEYVEREFALLDQQYAVVGVWDDAASRAVLRCETVDELLTRLIAERDAQREAA